MAGARVTASTAAPPGARAEAEANAAATAKRAEERAEELRRLNERVNFDQPNDMDDLDDDEDEGDPALMGDDRLSRSLRAQVPDRPVALRPGELACCACGAPTVAPAPDAQGSLVYARLIVTPAARDAPAYTADRVALTRCPTCAGLRDLAYRILAAHRGLQSRLGGMAVDRVEAGLSCLAACDVAPPAPDAAPAVIAALARLAGPGRGVRWQEQGVARIKGRCAPRPWACVPVSARNDASKAAAGFLRVLVLSDQPDRELPPPSVDRVPGNVPVDAACLLCGVTTVRVTASQAADMQVTGTSPWTLHRLPADRLGAHVNGPTRVSGYTCPACESAWHRAGSAWGPTVREFALASYCETQGRPDRARLARSQEMSVPAFGALVVDARSRKRPIPPPPDEPFGFVVWPGEVKPGTVDPVDAALRALEAAGLRPTALEPVE